MKRKEYLVCIILFLVFIALPLVYGITDSISKGSTKTYNLDGFDYEITCIKANEESQIATYSVNGESTTLLQGETTTFADGSFIRHLSISGGSCNFVFGSSTESTAPDESCDECSIQNEKWCDGNRVWSCQRIGNCLRVVNYDYCNSPYVCQNGQCVIPTGCENNNPPCSSGYTCVNNQCIKLCSVGLICEGNYVRSQKEDCTKTNVEYCTYGCSNGKCIQPTGCAYNNPPCSSGYECKNNQCIETAEETTEICADSCGKYNQRYCNGNNIVRCVYSNGCWREYYERTCIASQNQKCINGACVNVKNCKEECDTLGNTCHSSSEFHVFECKIDSASGCKKLVRKEDCTATGRCINGKCIQLKTEELKGCMYANPKCKDNEKCINNKCIYDPNIKVECYQKKLGNTDYCSESCKCNVGEGDCDSDDECVEGSFCQLNTGRIRNENNVLVIYDKCKKIEPINNPISVPLVILHGHTPLHDKIQFLSKLGSTEETLDKFNSTLPHRLR